MSEEQASERRQTIRIKLPRKPAAPRHSQAVVTGIALPNPSNQEQPAGIRFIFLFRRALFPIIQIMIAWLLAAMVLDLGECFQVIRYATAAYVGGLLLIIPRRETLTKTDEFLIRWGFIILCVISTLVANFIWSIRGHGF